MTLNVVIHFSKTRGYIVSHCHIRVIPLLSLYLFMIHLLLILDLPIVLHLLRTSVVPTLDHLDGDPDLAPHVAKKH